MKADQTPPVKKAKQEAFDLGVPHFHLEPSGMNATLDGLQLTLGEVNYFCHLGDCVHCFVVTEVRRFSHLLDTDDQTKYPVKIKSYYKKRKKCAFCGTKADFVVLNCKYLVNLTEFFCRECFVKFFYNSKGERRFEDEDARVFWNVQ